VTRTPDPSEALRLGVSRPVVTDHIGFQVMAAFRRQPTSSVFTVKLELCLCSLARNFSATSYGKLKIYRSEDGPRCKFHMLFLLPRKRWHIAPTCVLLLITTKPLPATASEDSESGVRLPVALEYIHLIPAQECKPYPPHVLVILPFVFPCHVADSVAPRRAHHRDYGEGRPQDARGLSEGEWLAVYCLSSFIRYER
jgi:hypothetical protein